MRSFRLPAYTEIPDVGLYLVQVTNYINSFLTDFPDMMVTASMISNYVKLKLVAKPIRKVYSREQIAHFLFIVMAKTVISMEDIMLLFRIRQKTCTPEQGYESFRGELMKYLSDFCSEGKPEETEPQSEEAVLLGNVASVVAHKMYLNQTFARMKEPEKEV